ncbi:MAG TPA: DMT family protein [Prolixibacteraceae bacterium]|nr:DMT family protein [Prolixibacteraceae bacterium]
MLVLSNTFMTLAWYGHLKFKEMRWFAALPLVAVILISWGIALFEYFFQVPANRIGYEGNGGPFTLMQLKVIQEVITLIVFTVFAVVAFKTETFRWNHLVAFVFLILAVYFVFKK